MLKNHYNVVVVGTGSAGIAAAVSAADSGCRTLVIEKQGMPGGIAAEGPAATLCGLFVQGGSSAPEWLYEGFPRVFASRLMDRDGVSGPIKQGRVWVLPCRPGTFRELSDNLLGSHRRIRVEYNAGVTGVQVADARIRHVDVTGSGFRERIGADVVVDCTGDAAVCAMAGLPVMSADDADQVPAVMFPLETTGGRFAERSSTLPVLVRIKRAVDSGDLPPGVEAVSFSPMVGGKTVQVKLNLGVLLKPDRPFSEAALERRANTLKRQLADFLIDSYDDVVDTESCRGVSRVLHRSGKRATGEYVLTRDDVLSGARFEDAVTRGGWPVEKWSYPGGLTLEYLWQGGYYDIPERSLRPQGIDNLLTAGKSISADSDAIASARVIGCCLATGESAGKLAARSG